MYVLIKEPFGSENIRYDTDNIELSGDYVIVDGCCYPFTTIKVNCDNTFDVVITDNVLFYKVWSFSIKNQIKEKIEDGLISILKGLTKYGNVRNGIYYWENSDGDIVIKYVKNILRINFELLWPYFTDIDLVKVFGNDPEDRYKILQDLIRKHLNIKDTVVIYRTHNVLKREEDMVIEIQETVLTVGTDLVLEPFEEEFLSIFNTLNNNDPRWGKNYWVDGNGDFMICYPVGTHNTVYYTASVFWKVILEIIKLKNYQEGDITKKLSFLFHKYLGVPENVNIEEYDEKIISKYKINPVVSYSVTKPTKTMAEIKSNMDILIAKRKLENDKAEPKQSAFDKMFAELTSCMVRYVDLNKFPSMLFWFRDGKCLIGLNFLTKEIFFDLDAIWSPFTYNLGCATNDTKYGLEKISKKYFINSPELSAISVLKVYDIKVVENYFNSTSKVD